MPSNRFPTYDEWKKTSASKKDDEIYSRIEYARAQQGLGMNSSGSKALAPNSSEFASYAGGISGGATVLEQLSHDQFQAMNRATAQPTGPTQAGHRTEENDAGYMAANTGLLDEHKTPVEIEAEKISRMNMLSFLSLMQMSRGQVTSGDIYNLGSGGLERTSVDRLVGRSL